MRLVGRVDGRSDTNERQPQPLLVRPELEAEPAPGALITIGERERTVDRTGIAVLMAA